MVKILAKQEGIDINAKYFYFDNFLFQNHIWNFIKLFMTALILAIEKCHIEIMEILVEEEGININAKNKDYFNNF